MILLAHRSRHHLRDHFYSVHRDVLESIKMSFEGMAFANITLSIEMKGGAHLMIIKF